MAGDRKPKGILRFVDIDETVFHTTAKVIIRSAKDNSVIMMLSNQEWNTYPRRNLQNKTEYADFSQFSDSRKFFDESTPIKPMVELLQEWSYQMRSNSQNSRDMVVFVTARGNFDDREVFLNTFRKQLIGIDDRGHFYVSRTGNLSDDVRINGSPLSTAQRKKIEYLHYLMAEMPSEAHLYEDDMKNIEDFLELKKEMPSIKYRVFHVKDDKITEVGER